MPGQVEQVNENLFNVGENVRVERGPRMIRARATKELLSDANTAAHYHLPRVVTTPDGGRVRIVARDALSQPIEEGREVNLLHWNEPTDQRPWYVYKLNAKNPRTIVAEHDSAGNAKKDKNGEVVTVPDPNHWEEIAVIDSFDDAVAFAQENADDGEKPAKGHVRASAPRQSAREGGSRH